VGNPAATLCLCMLVWSSHFPLW